MVPEVSVHPMPNRAARRKCSCGMRATVYVSMSVKWATRPRQDVVKAMCEDDALDLVTLVTQGAPRFRAVA